MEWAAILRDIAIGLVAAGMLAAWVPDSWWRSLFLTHHGTWANVWGPVIGPLVAVLSFVCSVGNVPLAAVLWNGGISFGGVIAFIFADLIILPILDIYRRYYGLRVAAFLFATLTASMVAAGLVVGFLFDGLGLMPSGRHAKVENASTAFGWNITTGARRRRARRLRGARLALLRHRGGADAADDGRADGRGPRPRHHDHVHAH